jgi:hypothetical protein
MSVSQLNAGKMPLCKMFAGQTSVGKMSVSQMSVELRPAGKCLSAMSFSEMFVSTKSFFQMPDCKMSIGKMSFGQMSFD